MKGILIVTVGIPGSGKTSWVKDYIEENKDKNIEVISSDEIRKELLNDIKDQSKNKEVAIIAKERFKECLRKKQNVVWDATNLRKEYREQLITLSHNYNALTKLLVFLDKESNIRKKDKGRKWSVSDSVIDKQIKSWQFPFETETHIVKYIHI